MSNKEIGLQDPQFSGPFALFQNKSFPQKTEATFFKDLNLKMMKVWFYNQIENLQMILYYFQG